MLTTLDKMAMPLLRYRTHDISCLHYEKCDCGRTLVRMDRIRRRSDDMLIIRGVNLFPSQVESLVMGMPGVVPHYELIVTRERAMDELEIRVEVSPDVIASGEEGQAKLARAIHVKIKQMVGISAKISLAEPGAIARCDGKTKHIIDKRQK